MKPILIFAEEKDGAIKLTKEEIQRVVDEAYEQGKQDGTVSYTARPITITPTWEEHITPVTNGQ